MIIASYHPPSFLSYSLSKLSNGLSGPMRHELVLPTSPCTYHPPSFERSGIGTCVCVCVFSEAFALVFATAGSIIKDESFVVKRRIRRCVTLGRKCMNTPGMVSLRRKEFFWYWIMKCVWSCMHVVGQPIVFMWTGIDDWVRYIHSFHDCVGTVQFLQSLLRLPFLFFRWWIKWDNGQSLSFWSYTRYNFRMLTVRHRHRGNETVQAYGAMRRAYGALSAGTLLSGVS